MWDVSGGSAASAKKVVVTISRILEGTGTMMCATCYNRSPELALIRVRATYHVSSGSYQRGSEDIVRRDMNAWKCSLNHTS